MAGRRVDGSSKVRSSPYTGPQSPAVALTGIGSRYDARCPAGRACACLVCLILGINLVKYPFVEEVIVA